MPQNKTNELVKNWREIGPAIWAESQYGWIGIDGQAVTLLPWQRAILSAWWERRDVITTLGISNVKKTGKTFLDAVITCWRWLALPGTHFCVANTEDQATSRQFDEVAKMCARHPYLSQEVKITEKVLTFKPTGSVLQALSSDYSGSGGANFLTVSHTEAWCLTYENDLRLWEELTPVPGKFYGLPCLRVADSYAGYTEESKTWHDVVDRGLQGKKVSKDWPIYQAGGLLLFHMEGQEAQKRCFRGTPEEAKEYYQEQRKTLRSNAYLRLHENIRTANIGNFCNQEDWEALIDPDLRPLKPGGGQAVYIGLDLAVSPKGDDCALIGTYYDAGKVKIAFHRVWKGRERLHRLSLTGDVGPYIERKSQEYNVVGVYFDPWQAIALAELLREKRINCVEIPQNRSVRGPKDTALYEMVSNSELALYDHDDLRYAPGGANAKELGNGQIFLTKAGGRAKIDLLVALSNCADECRHEGGVPQVTVEPDPWDETDRPQGAFTERIERGVRYLWCWPGTEKHKPGVTAENHHFITRIWDGEYYACGACVRELEAAGYYLEQRRIAKEAGQGMSEQEYEAWRYDLQHSPTPPPTLEEKQAELSRKLFWEEVKKNGKGKTQ